MSYFSFTSQINADCVCGRGFAIGKVMVSGPLLRCSSPISFQSSQLNTQTKYATRNETGQHFTAPKSPVKNTCISCFKLSRQYPMDC